MLIVLIGNWKDYSWVIRGKQRSERLLNKPQTPTEIKKKTKIILTNISRVLVQFEKKGLAKCLTPNETRSRVYDLKLILTLLKHRKGLTYKQLAKRGLL